MKPTPEQRLWSRITKTEACWLWTGGLDNRRGYGVLGVGGVPHAAYRLVYEALCGPIASGTRLVRQCATLRCVNPDHFEPVAYHHRSREERFWSMVHKTTNCWLWTGYIQPNGYGQFRSDGRAHRAHRVAYELAGKVVPSGYDLDHLCRVRHCVNPAHLEPVTRLENNRRGLGNPLRRRTHCKHGHSLADAFITKDGRRDCRMCTHNREHAYRRRKTRAYSDVARGEEHGVRSDPAHDNPRYPPRKGRTS